MTCTGCEKKLLRFLKLLSAASNIKTSLVLAQAEFDLCSPIASGSISNAIEKMTIVQYATFHKDTDNEKDSLPYRLAFYFHKYKTIFPNF